MSWHNWWRPEKFSPEEFETKSNEYLEQCTTNKRPKTLSWLCVFLWVYKDYISEKMKDERFSETIKKIRTIAENDVEEWILTNKYNPTAWIFNLKNNFWWKDKTEIDQNNTWEIVFKIKD